MAKPEAGIFPILGIALAAALAIAAFLPLLGRRLTRTPLTVWGMVLAHFGMAVSVAGMASESGFSSERLAVMGAGDSQSVAGWQVRFDGVEPVAGDNWVAMEGQMQAERDGATFELKPQSRNFFSPAQQTTEAALLTRWDGQLYAVIAPVQGGSADKWQVRLWWKPFVTFIWLGGILIALGGGLALLGRMFRGVKFRRKPVSEAGYAR